MRQIYIEAIKLVYMRISSCGKALQKITDEYELIYWQKQLNKAIELKFKIEKRSPRLNNVIDVNFKTKKRVA